MLTIIGGNLKGSKLKTPKGSEFRPTLGKTREALFSIVASRFHLPDYTCCDLFAGSGALGIEALSRGAAGAVFVENDRDRFLLLKKNIRHLSLERRCQLVKGDAMQWLANTRWDNRLTLFFVDPPYQTSLAQNVLDELGSEAAGLENSLVIVESHKKRTFEIPAPIRPFQQKVYGSTKLDFYQITNRSIP